MDEADKAYIEYLKSQGLSAEEAWEEYQKQSQPAVANTESTGSHITDTIKNVGKKGILGATKALGYLQNLTTSPLAALGTELYTGRDVFKPKEWIQSLGSLEPYQTPSQSLKMGGINIPQGFDLSDTGLVEKESPWNIGFSDTAIDVLSDPSTWLSGGLTAAAKIGTKTGAKAFARETAKSLPARIAGKITKPVGEALSMTTAIPRKATDLALRGTGLVTKEGTLTKAGKVANALVNPMEAYAGRFGKKSYQKAFAPLDWESSGSIAPSDILYDVGVSGGYTNVPETLKNISEPTGKSIENMYISASSLGAEVPTKVATREAKRIGKEFLESSNKEQIAAGKSILSRVKAMRDRYGDIMSPLEAWEESKSLNRISSANKFNPKARKQLSSSAEMKLAEGLKEQAMKSMEAPEIRAIDPQLSSDLKLANEIYKSTSGDIYNKALDKAKTQFISPKELLTITGGDILGGAAAAGIGAMMGYNPLYAGLAAPVVRRASQIFSTPSARTFRGNIAKELSSKPYSLLGKIPARQSTWSLMNQPEGEE